MPTLRGCSPELIELNKWCSLFRKCLLIIQILYSLHLVSKNGLRWCQIPWGSPLNDGQIFMFVTNWRFFCGLQFNTCVADPSRGRRNRDNAWLQFNGFIQTNWGTASPTQPQSVGGNYSPTSALMPRILTHINYSSTISHYIYSQVLASIIHPRTLLITFHIIHIPFPYYKYVRSCQERRLDWFCGNPAFPTSAEPCGSANQSEGPASQSRANHADERTNHWPDSGAHVNCLTSSVAFMPDIT